MTQEEKAKAYDMALEAARKELGVDRKEWKVVEHVLRNIFPELRESEDERVRRTLMEYFGPSAQLDFIRGVPIQKIRDWLENQKESLHIPESCKENADSLTSDEPTPSVILDEQGRVFATQQKDQKPAEWSEEDERKIVELKTFIAQCNGFNKSNKQKAFEMIDSLRPGWKR